MGIHRLSESQKINWVSGDDLWRVTLNIQTLPYIRLLSGLVEIHEIVYIPNCTVILHLKCLDDSGILFRNGDILGISIKRYRPFNQPVAVEAY